MGKKAKLYLIVLVNLLAWGYVGVKVYGALQGDDDFELSHDKLEIKKMDEKVKEEIIVLSLNYTDPFLKNGNFANTHHTSLSSGGGNSPKPKNPNPVPKPVVIVNTPQPLDIRYMGLVKNSEKGTETAMLTINGRSVFVKQNDLVEGMSIKQIFKDSIITKKGKEKLVIRR